MYKRCRVDVIVIGADPDDVHASRRIGNGRGEIDGLTGRDANAVGILNESLLQRHVLVWSRLQGIRNAGG